MELETNMEQHGERKTNSTNRVRLHVHAVGVLCVQVMGKRENTMK